MTQDTNTLKPCKLLPCPFCQGRATLYVTHGTEKDESPRYKGKCVDCKAESRRSHETGKAIAAWNTRTPTQDSQQINTSEKRVQNSGENEHVATQDSQQAHECDDTECQHDSHFVSREKRDSNLLGYGTWANASQTHLVLYDGKPLLSPHPTETYTVPVYFATCPCPFFPEKAP